MTDAAANVAFFPRPCSGEFGMFNDVLPLPFLTSTLSLSRRLHQNSIVSSKTVLNIIIRKNLTSLDLLVRSLALPLFCVKFSVTRSLLDPSFSSLVLRRPRSYNFPFFLSLPFTCLHVECFFHTLLTKAHCSLDLCTKDLTSHIEKRSCTIVSFLYFFVLFSTLKHGFL